MLGVILHFDFFVLWELLRPNLERRISLNVFSCDYGDSGSEIGITFFTAVWRGQVCRCAESRANAPRPSPEVCRSLWPPVFFMWLPAPSPQKQKQKNNICGVDAAPIGFSTGPQIVHCGPLANFVSKALRVMGPSEQAVP